MYQPTGQQDNLYPAQPGPVPAEPILPPTQPAGFGQPIQPVAQPYNPPPGSYGQPTYQPPVQNQQQPIVVQQYVNAPPVKLKSSPVSMFCPHCKKTVTTVVSTQFNCLNCCFCFCFCLLWLIVELVSDKDLNCTDATHKCPNCKNVIGVYRSC